jgi:hypothetical protein
MVEKVEDMEVLSRMKITDLGADMGRQGGEILEVADRPISNGDKGGMRDNLIRIRIEVSNLICAKT